LTEDGVEVVLDALVGVVVVGADHNAEGQLLCIAAHVVELV
jgi:hypothetical protein